MADTDWNLHSKQLTTPTDNDRMLVEPSDETAKAVEVGGFRNWLMSTALFNTLTTTAKNIIGAIEEVKGIADLNTTQLNEKANIASPNFTGTPTVSSKNIATTETATLTFLNGWNNLSGSLSKVSRNGSQVTLCISCQGGSLTANAGICVLPSQFRPSTGLLVWGIYEDVSYVAHDMLFSIDIYGNVAPTNVLTGNTRLIISVSFTI